MKMKLTARMFVVLTLLPASAAGQWKEPGHSYVFDRRDGQVEVGGPFAGAEFHHSRPLCSRISFYYPVANSIDVSTDYWRRDTSLPMAVGIQVDDGARTWIGRDGWTYTLAPHTVTFDDINGSLHTSVQYAFGFHEPVMAATLTVRNISPRPLLLRLYTHLKLTLRTCQTYAWKDSAWTHFDPVRGVIAARFDDSDAARPCSSKTSAIRSFPGPRRRRNFRLPITARPAGSSSRIRSAGASTMPGGGSPWRHSNIVNRWSQEIP